MKSLNIIEILIIPNLIYKVNAILIGIAKMLDIITLKVTRRITMVITEQFSKSRQKRALSILILNITQKLH